MESGRNRRKGCGWCGIIAAGLAVVVAAFLLFAWPRSWPPRRTYQTQCAANLKLLGVAADMYMGDWDALPAPISQNQHAYPAWRDYLEPYVVQLVSPCMHHDAEIVNRVFRCPAAQTDRMTYSFNRRVSGLTKAEFGKPCREGTVASTTIFLFDSVNDSPQNNNLNGDSVWHPGDSRLPKPGYLTAWPRNAERLAGDWPEWARPRHGGHSNILWLDGHVSSVTGEGMEKYFSPATH